MISGECSLLLKILNSTSSKETILARNEYPPETRSRVHPLLALQRCPGQSQQTFHWDSHLEYSNTPPNTVEGRTNFFLKYKSRKQQGSIEMLLSKSPPPARKAQHFLCVPCRAQQSFISIASRPLSQTVFLHYIGFPGSQA